jgi:fatty acid desaturase
MASIQSTVNATYPLEVAGVRAIKLSDVLSADEIRPFLMRSDARAFLMLGSNLAILFIAFALPVFWFNPLTVVLAILLLGGRQLGLAVIYHDCSHSVYFRTKWLNDFIGHWVCGALLNTSLYAYRTYHFKHHRFAGTVDDPDLEMASAYPTNRAGLQRKFLRDISGRTGVKSMKAQLSRFDARRNAPFLVSHIALLSVLTITLSPWVYALWWLAYLSVHQLITRLRFIGEHGIAIDRLSMDARENTCTTRVSVWERLLVAPNFVNYHLEHHLNAAVPCYRLPLLHNLLADKGFFAEHDCLSDGYRDVLRKAASAV